MHVALDPHIGEPAFDHADHHIPVGYFLLGYVGYNTAVARIPADPISSTPAVV